MTVVAKGFGNDLVDEREWSLIHHMGNQGRTGMTVANVGGDRTVQVAVGMLVVGGIHFEVTVAENLQSAANSSGSTRFDVAIARLTWSTNTAALAIKQGTPGSGEPVLQQDMGVIWEEPLARLQVANGQGAFAGSDVVAKPSAMAWLRSESNTNFSGTVTTTYSAGSPVVGVVFTAPPSGKVDITVGGQVQNVTSGELCALVYEVRSSAVVGSGTIIQAMANGYGVEAGTAANTRVTASHSHVVTGLTPGYSYNVRTLHGTGGGTGSVFFRELTVRPVREGG